MVKITIMKKTNDNEIAFYKSEDGRVNIEVRFDVDNIWLSQKKMAELFACSSDNISLHIKNIYKSGELKQAQTAEEYSVIQIEGNRDVSRKILCYNLELVIAVGYKVNSERGAEFRAWATSILKGYIQKGYALDSDRMKFGSRFSTRYFEDLYEEIRDIRTSERRIYQKITDIYATSIDYSSTASESKQFFATVQNKLHFAITGKTAAEIVVERVSNKKDKMGLTSWRKYPAGKIMPSDVTIAKNYLGKEELVHLDRIGNMYLDYAELQTARGKTMAMSDWIEKLNTFLNFNEYEILTNTGKISHEVAESLALNEYEKYRAKQDSNYISDFDRLVLKIKDNNKNEKGPSS